MTNTIQGLKTKQSNLQDIFNTTIKNWTDSMHHVGDLEVKLTELEMKLNRLESRIHEIDFQTIGNLGSFYLAPNVNTYQEGITICNSRGAHLIGQVNH